MIKIYRKTVRDEKPSISSELTDLKGSFVYCTSPSNNEVEALANKLDISPSLILDALDPLEVPRLEESNGTVFAISSFPMKEGVRLIGVPFAVAASESFVSIISCHELKFLENWFENGSNFITTQKTKLVNLIFKKLMEEYFDQLRLINKEVH